MAIFIHVVGDGGAVPLLHANRRPLVELAQRERVAVLIAGLQDRLLINSKAKYVVNHLAGQGFEVDVFVDVAGHSAEVGAPYKHQIGSVRSVESADPQAIDGIFRKAGARYVDVKIAEHAEDPHVPPVQPTGWDRFHIFSPFSETKATRAVGQNLMRRFVVVERLMGRASARALEDNIAFDYVLLDKDDNEWLAPFNLLKIMAGYLAPHAVYSKNCRNFDGINDKTLLFTWTAAVSMLGRISSDMWVPDPRLNSVNSEIFWMHLAATKSVHSTPVDASLLPTSDSVYVQVQNETRLCQKDFYICPELKAMGVNACSAMGTLGLARV